MFSAILIVLVVWTSRCQQIPYHVYYCVHPFCSGVEKNVTDAIIQHAAPGMAFAAINSTSGAPLLIASAGRFTYEDWDAIVTRETSFDMASCSKVMGTTTATAMLYQQGYLGLDDYVSSSNLLGAGFASQGKGNITIRNLLLHNAGFPPDPSPGYSSHSFGCPETAQYHPGQQYSCDKMILDNLLYNQTIVTPPGEKFVYSDLSMITLMFVVGRVVQRHALVASMVAPCLDSENIVCQFHAFVLSNIFQPLSMDNTSYVPTNAEYCVPQWNDPVYRHSFVKGFVSDENSYALGGIAGHAGVFTNVMDAVKLMKVWMWATEPKMLNETTIKLFITVANLTQSSRALGWDTNNQAYRWCGTFSNETFLHIGFTGTELCGDPVTGVTTVMLANGRYPDYTQDGMIWYRPAFNQLIHDLYVTGNV